MTKHGYWILVVSFIFSSMNCYALKQPDTHSTFNIVKIQQLTGSTGQFDSEEQKLTIIIPREDLAVQMSGMHFTGSRGLSSNIIFQKADDKTSLSGDLVLLQDQVNPVLSIALANGVKVTGINNPYLWDSPRIMLMHIQGEGDALQLANAIGKILTKIKSTANGNGDFPLGNVYSPETTLNGHRVDMLLGTKGRFNDDVYEVEFDNGVKKTDTELNKIMATHTWAAFSGSDQETVVNGGIVVHQSELQQALLTLRKAQFYILAIYQNSYGDDPTLMSVNFWGVGRLEALAKALRSSFLIAQNGVVSSPQAATMLATSLASSLIKTGKAIPISSELVQNNYCSYANALRTSSAPIEKESIDKNSQTATNGVTHVIPVAVKKTMPMVIEVKKASPTVMSSAGSILSKLSVIHNNQIVEILLPRHFSQTTVAVIDPMKKISYQGVVTISAKRILSKLSVIEQNKLKNYLESRPKNINFVSVHDQERIWSKLRDAEIKLEHSIAIHMRPAFSTAPFFKNHKPLPRLSMLSAREVLARLSVVKNNSLILNNHNG